MGEAWKARDTRLDRIVAVKVSKSEFSERFEREARAVAAGLVVVAALAGWGISRFSQPTAPEQAVRFQLHAPEGGRIDPASGMAVSPDGRMLAYVANVQGKSEMWVRPLDSAVARHLPGTENGRGPFWPPDSRSIAFGNRIKLWRVELTGGAPVPICDAFGSSGA